MTSLPSQSERTIRVVVIEDSPIQREAIVEILEEGGIMQVVAAATTGAAGVEAVKTHAPDLVTCDIGLPDIEGFVVVERLMAEHPVPIVILTATLRPDWRKDAYHALSLGAIEVIEKPGFNELNDPTWRRRLQRELHLVAKSPVIPHVLDRIKKRHRKSHPAPAPRVTPAPGGPAERASFAESSILAPAPPSNVRTELIVIVGSAGGPKATRNLLEALRPSMPLPVPVVVALHLGPNMGTSFARFLTTSLEQEVYELSDGDFLKPGHIHVTPGRMHTELHAGNQVRIFSHLPDASHSPSLDYLLWSVARVHGKNAIGVIMTGMGSDGAKGLLAMRRFGAFTLGQDPQSCLVYGMPKVAAELGAVCAQLSPEKIAQNIRDRMQFKRADEINRG